MYGHIMLLAAFFMESQPPTGTIMIVIINFEFQYGAHTGQAVEHRESETSYSHTFESNVTFITFLSHLLIRCGVVPRTAVTLHEIRRLGEYGPVCCTKLGDRQTNCI